ncbi:MAG: hypothetical protein ABUL60_05160 [Myxococcales bacterium]
MGNKRRVWGWLLLACGGVGACDQELVIPNGMKGKTTSGVDAPSEGFTGVGGAADESAPTGRLPVATGPVFTSFGGAGAGGDGADESEAGAGQAAVSRGGTPAAGGMKGAAGSAAAAGGNSGRGGLGGRGEAGGGEAGGGEASLMFSEYVEGSGSFKALEIYALTASSLEGCELRTYFNGKLEPSRLALHGSLAQGQTQVLCSSALAAAEPGRCDRSTSLTFNGDDALALACGPESLDVIGQIGVDPGDSWGVGATLDHTLRRRCEVLGGRRDGTSAFEIDAEWLTLGVDTFSDLGVRNCTP